VDEVVAAGHTAHAISHISELESLLKRIMLPAAIFAANDEYSTRVLAVSERLGLRVPEQIAIVGVDNDDLLVESGSVSLSSIELPTFKVGFEAAAMLHQILRGEALARTLIMLPPVGVVTRKSSDITAIADPDLTAALAFIRQHVAEPIGVPDVVAAVPLSRRVLERRFQKYLQRSALEEIQRVRLERARSLLIDTELSIEDVASASGFSGRSRFHATFANVTGHTPREFRRIYKRGMQSDT
jgi:LacI family transcriptional regulator